MMTRALAGLVGSGLIERGLGRFLVLADGVAVGTIAFILWRGIKASVRQVPTAEASVG